MMAFTQLHSNQVGEVIRSNKVYQLRKKIRDNRDELLNLVFEEKTDWAKISKLALENEKIEKKLKGMK